MAMVLTRRKPAVQAERVEERPDPEVPEKARRRRFTAEYKLKVLAEADRASEPGAVGALLRREGLYSSHLSAWRRQREEGKLGDRPRGRLGRHPLERENEALRKENARLRRRLEQAQTVIDVKKKLSRALGIDPETPEESET